VHYWDGAAPVPHRIRDISSSGLYLLTEQRWYPGTMVRMSLQSGSVAETDPDRSITVNAKVVRSGTDGVGLALVLPESHAGRRKKNVVSEGADRRSFLRFLQSLMGQRGQALIEYILVLPLVFLLVVNVVNFGGFYAAFIAVTNASRAGADYAILGLASVGSLQPATASQVSALIASDLSSLPNKSSLMVNICQNNDGTITTLAGTCTSVPSDPEPTSYVLTSIDVTYTYTPFIPLFSFPSLHVFATIPPTTIHRRAVMRSIQ
jgi:Flp pilus assembly protein TadG